MKTTKSNIRCGGILTSVLFLALALVVGLCGTSRAAPLGTAFMYQGLLIDGNDVLDGSYDLIVSLFDDPNEGELRGTVFVDDLDVNDGWFEIMLDFGDGVFDGSARWLETAVRPGELEDPNEYVILLPRWEVTPTPYALYAKTAGTAQALGTVGGVPDTVYVADNGNVGIGTTSPSEKLDVEGNIHASGLLTSGSSIAIDGTNDRITATSGTIDFDNENLVTTGNVGIGTTNPMYKLEVNGLIVGRFEAGDIVLARTGSRPARSIYYEKVAEIVLGQGGTVRVVLRLFGTRNAFTVYGRVYRNGSPVGTERSVYVSSWGVIEDFTEDIGGWSPGDLCQLYLKGSLPGKTEQKAAGSLTIKVGPGPFGSPAGKSEVCGWSDSGNGVYGYATGSEGNGVYGYATGSEGNGVYGYATGSDSAGVEGTGGNTGVVGSGNAYDFYAEGPGTNYGSTSSIRWKRDTRPIDNPLGKVLRLRGVYFNWDEEHGGHHDVGMVAEEVGEVLPEIVEYEEDGRYATGMDYSKLTPLLVEAVKALKLQVDELQNQQAEKNSVIEALKKHNDKLEDRLAAMESSIAKLALQLEGGTK